MDKSELVDVRNAFRLLKEYQEVVNGIVRYIKRATVLPEGDIKGHMLYSSQLKLDRGSDYGTNPLGWGWDFLCGYVYEHFLGEETIDHKSVEMSIVQMSDDGAYISRINGTEEKWTDTPSFINANDSHSYLIFYIYISKTNRKGDWLFEEEKDKYDRFLINYLNDSNNKRVIEDNDGETQFFIRYELERFREQSSTDEIIRDIAKYVYGKTQIKVFEDRFYQDSLI